MDSQKRAGSQAPRQGRLVLCAILSGVLTMVAIPAFCQGTSGSGASGSSASGSSASGSSALTQTVPTGEIPAALPGLVPLGSFEGGQAWKSEVGGYPVLRLQGSWRAMGRQYGKLLSRELREFCDAIKADMTARGFTTGMAEEARSVVDTYPEKMKNLLEGMAETSGLSMEEHIFLETSFFMLPGLVLANPQSAPSCSGIAVSAPRTADGKLYFARNWDMTQTAMRPYLKYMALVVFNPDDGSLGFANIRPLGQIYVETGINEKGVLLEVNNGSASDPGQNPDGTFVVAELFELVNACATVDEAVQRLIAVKLDSSYLIQAADAHRAVSVEKPTFDTHLIEQKNGALYALNNFAQPIPEAWKGKIKEIPTGYRDDRQPRLDAILASEEWNGHVTLESVRNMMDRNLERGGPVVDGTFGTVLQVIAVPEDLIVLFRGYEYSDWAEVCLSGFFGSYTWTK